MAAAQIGRRTVLKGAATATSGLAVVQVAGPQAAFAREVPPGTVIPWSDQPPPIPAPAQDVLGRRLRWESLDSFYTPNDQFFTVKHYGDVHLSASAYRLAVEGLVAHPQRLSLAQLKALPHRAVDFTLECSGDNGLPFIVGAIGTARWGGTPLHSLLRSARPLADDLEVVFWGADKGQVTIQDNSGVTGPGRTGSVAPDATGGLDLTITEHFARSMSLREAMAEENLLCYQMNGEPLPTEHGFPVRLIAPGWYGVANVKWLNRIEVRHGRYAGRFMARDYVTIREEQHGGETIWTFTTVNHDRLKSAPAKVVRTGDAYRVFGAAWGAPVRRVDVRIDDGPWRRARLHRRLGRAGASGFAWRFWTFDWGHPTPGDHAVTSRAFDEHGQVQPRPQDAAIANRRTFWENNGEITRHVTIPAR
jgi:DMSO/TMAO reductase YedYZ molybdopterin-dependent catalytic subunit